jgi:hypothetical protein
MFKLNKFLFCLGKTTQIEMFFIDRTSLYI